MEAYVDGQRYSAITPGSFQELNLRGSLYLGTALLSSDLDISVAVFQFSCDYFQVTPVINQTSMSRPAQRFISLSMAV